MFTDLFKLILLPVELIISFFNKMFTALTKWFTYNFLSSVEISNEQMLSLYAFIIIFIGILVFLIFRTALYLQFYKLQHQARKERKQLYYWNLENKQNRFNKFADKFHLKRLNINLEQQLKTNPTLKQRWENKFFKI